MTALPFELSQLRAFIAVAEELNFRRAAQRLNMSQPPLSRQIKQLEHNIGADLFDRNNRSVRLTSAGESFLADATGLLERAEFARLAARQAARGEAGAIALGFVPSASTSFAPMAASALRSALPGVRLQLFEMMSYEQIEALSSSQLDLGLVRRTRQGFPAQADLVVSEPFALALPRDHPLVAAEKVTIGDLDGLDMISYSGERGGVLEALMETHFHAAGISPNILYTVSQTHSVAGLVNAGLGVALLPVSTTSLELGNVIYRPIDLPASLRSDLYLARGAGRDNPITRAVARTLIAVLKHHAPTPLPFGKP